jgi:hypothetical protein
MGIDGIGKPPGGGAPPTGAGSPVDKKGSTFRVDKAGEPAAAGPANAVGASENLGRLERGEINLDQYLDAQVEQAVGPLKGQLSSEQLSFVESTLREQLVSDPVLAEWVRRATGSLPTSE